MIVLSAPNVTSPVRLGVLGGHRGLALARASVHLAGKASVVAVCDTNSEVLGQWQIEFPGIRAYTDERALQDDSDVDAVIIATPVPLHATQAMAFLRAGKHVLSEVLACRSIDEGQALVEAVDHSGLVYMMAENSCYIRSNLLVENLARRGMFGQVTHLAGGYLHDVRSLAHDENGALTWRGEARHASCNISYPTHALGPLMQWLQAANGADDTPVSLIGATSSTPAVTAHFRELFGPDHPGADPGYWAGGDTGTVLITTRSGAIVNVRVDMASPRPHRSGTTYHELQGSKGLFVGSRSQAETPLVWFEAGFGPASGISGADDFRCLQELADEYEHPLWRDHFGHEDVLEGHDGGDFFVVERFVTAIHEPTTPVIDVRKAVTWTIVNELSERSILRGGQPVSFPEL